MRRLAQLRVLLQGPAAAHPGRQRRPAAEQRVRGRQRRVHHGRAAAERDGERGPARVHRVVLRRRRQRGRAGGRGSPHGRWRLQAFVDGGGGDGLRWLRQEPALPHPLARRPGCRRVRDHHHVPGRSRRQGVPRQPARAGAQGHRAQVGARGRRDHAHHLEHHPRGPDDRRNRHRVLRERRLLRLRRRRPPRGIERRPASPGADRRGSARPGRDGDAEAAAVRLLRERPAGRHGRGPRRLRAVRAAAAVAARRAGRVGLDDGLLQRRHARGRAHRRLQAADGHRQPRGVPGRRRLLRHDRRRRGCAQRSRRVAVGPVRQAADRHPGAGRRGHDHDRGDAHRDGHGADVPARHFRADGRALRPVDVVDLDAQRRAADGDLHQGRRLRLRRPHRLCVPARQRGRHPGC
mmetsp:Transcript_2870/g.10158  ORF Transcript_2870/g.10158 Transcript_2870/m.10158 type:complete len:406 (-) Transcript_2870:1294-2511(-)